MAKTPEEMTASMIENLKGKTGKSLDEWLSVARKTKLDKHKQLVDHLKAEHGVGHGYANLIAQKALQPELDSASGDDLVSTQYAGPKAGLRPIYDALIKVVTQFGPDAEISPKKTYVSLRRNKQFGLIQPTTATRVDVGINLKGVPPTERLEASGSFNAMVSHRVRLSSPGDVDKELTGWLKKAYESA